ncbi:MAG: CPBP family intramembrane glutamic endopeptidase [Actinomycetota bacterium]
MLTTAFKRWPLPMAIGLGLAWLPATWILREVALFVLPPSDYEDRLAHGFQQLALGLMLLAVFGGFEWTKEAWLDTRPRLRGGLLGLTALAVVPAVAVLAVGLAQVDVGETTAMAVSAFNYTTVGVTEELWFRGLVLGGLMVAWGHERWGPLAAAVVSSALFGLIHLDPYLIVFAGMLGMGLAHLTLGTWSIWPAVAVHIFYNLFYDLPRSTAGVDGGWYYTLAPQVVRLAAVVAGGVLLWRAVEHRLRPRPQPDAAPAPVVAGGQRS